MKSRPLTWFTFNREYGPLGWNSTVGAKSIVDENAYPNHPIYTKYKGLTEKAILKIITDPDKIQRIKKVKLNAFSFIPTELIRNQINSFGRTILK